MWTIPLQQPEQIQERFETENSLDIKPNYNIAPGQMMPVIVRNSPNRIALMKWGLVPSWAKDPKIGYVGVMLGYLHGQQRTSPYDRIR